MESSIWLTGGPGLRDGADLRGIVEITAITHKETNGYAFSQCKFKITNSLYKLVPELL